MNEQKSGYEELGFAKLDTERWERTGFPEVVFCEGKPDTCLAQIFKKLYEINGEVFGTRASQHQYEIVKKAFEAAYEEAVAGSLRYDGVSRIMKLEKADRQYIGRIAVCSAGTADIPVAEEAAQTAEFFGSKVDRIFDIGISGLHRLVAQLDRIRAANCVVAVAGMEGALASVLGGLVENPVIAVPTSVGYGVSEGGRTALHAMLSSCANGIAVVNIDNGYGAGYLATQINRLAAGSKG
ncbi:MAG: nickel pincer cofactor biosynthesis protein LarB [Lachnospiraceae bacterium]|nr:nickel pincer cofactor biosynthesis protein LarB [Lachnospiraceae bacterium]